MIQRDVSDKRFQIDSLDGLRGLAALIVVFSHTSNSSMFFLPYLNLRGIGKSGVFLFFLLSSFLLTLPLLKKGREILTFPVMAHYWQRRFFRIYPLYTLYLLLGIVSTWILANFFAKVGVAIPFELDWKGFLDHITLQKGKGVTWSIAVEFKFYFILPALVLVVSFTRSQGTWAVYLLLLALLLISQIISPQSESIRNDARLMPYMPIFIIGMLLAVIQDNINIKGKTKNIELILKYLGYVGMAGIIIMTPLAYSRLGDRVPNDYFHKQIFLYAISWSFILLSAVNVPSFIKKFFTMPILRFYGALSFSLYLFHPIFVDLVNRIGMNEYLSAWVVLLASTVSSYVSFKLLEGPVSKYKINTKMLSPIIHITRRGTLTK